MKKQIIFAAVIIFIALALPGTTFSQAGAPPPPPPPPQDTEIPLDGGLTLLLATGIGYGVKQFKSQRNKKRN